MGETVGGAGAGAVVVIGGGRMGELLITGAADKIMNFGPNATCASEVVAGFGIVGAIIGGVIGFRDARNRDNR